MGRVTSTPTSRWTRSLTGIAAAATLLLAACAGSDDAADSSVDGAEQPAAESVDADTVALVQTAPVAITGEPLPPYSDPQNDPAVGMSSPVLAGVSFDGSPVVIGEPTENATLVVFLAHWCPACNAEVPELVELADTDAVPAGVDVVGVSTAVTEDRDNFPPSEWFDDQGWPFTVMADSADAVALDAVGATAFPFLVVLDTDGTVLARKAGQSTGAETLEFLDAALAPAGA
jgi:thiol-disulfide isomerase/thioredoxin